MLHDDDNTGDVLDPVLFRSYKNTLVNVSLCYVRKVVDFRKHVPEKLKLVEANDDNIYDLANKITLDVKTRSPKYSEIYHLKDLTLEKAKEHCNESFLAFISNLYQKDLLPRSQCV